uniref:Opsin 1 (cone pigments), short-wave-sensitive 1 n=1 Tax=Oryzias latipes TaxID=8090 RepID=A0A3B3H9D5_ORYLA
MGKYFYLYENISKVGPYDGPQYYLAPTWAFYLQAAFMGFVFFVGTPLNFVVLLATAKYKKLRVPLNYILVNITFAGFIFVTFSVSQVFLASVRGYYFFGQTLCALEAAVGAVAGTVNSTVLSLQPSSLAATTDVMRGVVLGYRYIPEGLGCSCGPDWYTNCEEFSCASYSKFLLVTCFICPITIIIFSYSQLLGALRAVAAQQAESASTQKAEKEVSRMIIVMVASFVTCYGPYALTAQYYAYSQDENKDYRLVTIPAFFSKSSCVYNPLIYAFMNKQFNGCIMEMVFGKKMEEASEVSSKTEVSTAS